MAAGVKLILVHEDHAGNEIRGLRFEILAADPTGGDLYEGRAWYNSTSDQYKGYANGTVVVLQQSGASGVSSFTATTPLENTGTAADPVVALKTGSGAGTNGVQNTHIASDAAIALSKLATDPLARANHTGSQAAATISDLAAVVKAYRLDEFADPNSDIPMATFKFSGLGAPSAADDSATKGYVDSVAAGLAPKDAVRVASTANGTLATAFENGDTIDGVALVTGDRILLKAQTAPAENGIYTVNASGAPTRATDADSSADLIGAAVFVSEGTTLGNTLWVMTTDGPITVGTTGLVWSQFGGPGEYTASGGIVKTGIDFALDVPVTIARGGTGQITAPLALAALGGTGRASFDVGDNSATSFVKTHALAGGRDILAQLRRNSTPWDVVEADIEMTSTTTVTVRFTVAPTTDQFRLTLIG